MRENKTIFQSGCNRAEAAAPPSTPDRPVSADRRKNPYTGRVIGERPTHRSEPVFFESWQIMLHLVNFFKSRQIVLRLIKFFVMPDFFMPDCSASHQIVPRLHHSRNAAPRISIDPKTVKIPVPGPPVCGRAAPGMFGMI